VPAVPPGVYYVRLRAQNACGVSGPSAEVIVTVAGGCVAPTAPTLAASVNGGVVSLSWTAPAVGTAPVTYTLLAGSTPGASNLAIAPMGAATSLQTLVPNGTYFVRVAASNACGTSVSNEATVVVGLAGGAPQLTFTITPNPVPFTGVFAGCAGSTTAQKTWVYTLRITNQGTGPFTIGSFNATVTSPLLSAPFVTPYPAAYFALAFGAATIPPQGSLQGPLCVYGHFDEATLTWRFVDVSGAQFTAPVIQFLRSPF
jgi:predicted phage tail protein